MVIATVLDETPKVAIKPLIESSIFRSYRAYVEAGFDKDIPHDITAPYEREMKFLTQVDLEKGPLTRRIRRMVRRKENGKEYLTFTEDWKAKDWVGRDIKNPIIDNLEGLAKLPRIIPNIDEKGQKIGRDLDGWLITYEIEFSKEMVDKWIEDTGTDKNEITYTVRTSNRRDNCVTYEQFVDNNWTQALDIMMQDGGFELAYVESLRPEKDKDKDNKTKKA